MVSCNHVVEKSCAFCKRSHVVDIVVAVAKSGSGFYARVLETLVRERYFRWMIRSKKTRQPCKIQATAVIQSSKSFVVYSTVPTSVDVNGLN